jgi:hypothetical protein
MATAENSKGRERWTPIPKDWAGAGTEIVFKWMRLGIRPKRREKKPKNVPVCYSMDFLPSQKAFIAGKARVIPKISIPFCTEKILLLALFPGSKKSRILSPVKIPVGREVGWNCFKNFHNRNRCLKKPGTHGQNWLFISVHWNYDV